MPRKISFWQWVFYISWSVLGIWILLKIAGIIKTPYWLEFGLPAASAFIAILGLYQNLLEQITKLSVGFATLTARFDHLHDNVKSINTKTDVLDAKVNHLDLDVEFIKKNKC